MRHILLKGAAVVAAGLMGSIGWAQTNWTYSETDDGKSITDGKWVIAVTKYDSGAGTMTLGAITTASGDGVLDLRDMVVDGTAITGLSFPGQQAWESAAVTNFYVNHVAGTSVPTMLRENTQLREVELESETIQQITANPRPFAGCSKLGRVVFKCPNLLNWNQNQNWGNNPFSGTVVSNAFHEIVNPGVTNVGENMFVGLYKTCGDMILTNLQFISTGNRGAFYGGGATMTFSKITNIWIRTSQTAGFNMQPGFGAKSLRIEAPNLVTFGSLQGFGSVTNDARQVVPIQVQEFPKLALSSFSSLTGSIVLTNVTKFATGNYIFQGCTKVCNMELGGPIESIGDHVIEAALTNLVLNTPKLTNVVAAASTTSKKAVFTFNTTKAALTILGPVEREASSAWTQEMVDNLLEGVGAVTDVSKMVMTMYCSKKQGWATFAGCTKLSDLELTEAQKASVPAGCFGVYKTAAGAIKAWMVHKAQDTDPTGLCIRVQ